MSGDSCGARQFWRLLFVVVVAHGQTAGLTYSRSKQVEKSSIPQSGPLQWANMMSAAVVRGLRCAAATVVVMGVSNCAQASRTRSQHSRSLSLSASGEAHRRAAARLDGYKQQWCRGACAAVNKQRQQCLWALRFTVGAVISEEGCCLLDFTAPLLRLLVAPKAFPYAH